MIDCVTHDEAYKCSRDTSCSSSPPMSWKCSLSICIPLKWQRSYMLVLLCHEQEIQHLIDEITPAMRKQDCCSWQCPVRNSLYHAACQWLTPPKGYGNNAKIRQSITLAQRFKEIRPRLSTHHCHAAEAVQLFSCYDSKAFACHYVINGIKDKAGTIPLKTRDKIMFWV